MNRIRLSAKFRDLFPTEKLPVLLKLGMDVPARYIPHFLHEENKPRQVKG